MKINDPKGSVWRKWDLHVHTINSFEHSFSPADWDVYITKLKEKAIEHNIEVIGINDYFTVDGYKYICENFAIKAGNNFYLETGKKRLYLFPVVELRTNNFLRGKALNIHLIFNPEIRPASIENDFLHKLRFEYKGKKFNLKKEDLLRIGLSEKENKDVEKIDLEEVTSKGEEEKKKLLKIAYKIITVEKESLEKALKESILRDQIIVALVAKPNDGLEFSYFERNGRLATVLESFLSLHENICIFTNKKEDIEKFMKTYAKPCLWGSDAHRYERLFIPNGDGKSYTWIKADPTFEGLKQIIYEPEERVKIQENNPSEDYPKISCIDSIELESSKISEDLEFEDKTLPLNHNLIAIIGGRGSGKTALLDIIASCFEDSFEMIKENEDSFYKRAFGDKEGDKTLKVRLKVKGEEAEFEKMLGAEDNKFKEGFRIEYIPQNYLDEIVANYRELTDKIKKLLFEKLPYKKEEEDKLKRELEDIKSEIKSINSKLVSLKRLIKTKESLLKEKASEEGKLKRVLDEIRKHESQDSPVNIKNITSERTKLARYINKLEKVKNNLEKEIGVYELERTIQSLKDINEELDELSKRGEPVDLFPIDELESFKWDLKKIYRTNLAVISQKIQIEREKLKKLDSELEKYKEKSSKLAELLNKKSKLETEIERLQKRIKEIEGLESVLQEKILQKEEQLKKFFSKVKELKNFYTFLIEEFMEEVEGDEVLKNITFKLFINDNRESYREEILSNIHKGRIRRYYDEIEKTIEEVFGKIKEFLSNGAENLEELIKTLFQLENLLLREDFYKSATSEEKILNDIDIFELEFYIDLYLKGKPLKKLSIGERAVAMLKLYLAYDDVPLLIDQPEEGLDNSYISTELVETLKKAKKKRQIIIATHNANLVVNTDAEQIIVAEYKDGRISYTSGALENPEIREKIITILEGGKQAFENREKKLGIRT